MSEARCDSCGGRNNMGYHSCDPYALGNGQTEIKLANRAIDERDALRAELTELRLRIPSVKDEAQRKAERAVVTLCKRWCNRPADVIREGAEPLANDIALWHEMRRRVNELRALDESEAK